MALPVSGSVDRQPPHDRHSHIGTIRTHASQRATGERENYRRAHGMTALQRRAVGNASVTHEDEGL
ncbi:DUF221 domain protein [Aspergillus luchuensis]|uniref:DUF221 domain protein n=1 Tax=Aspergillus kawachii TaxID=1069201 RepID=A0A146FAN3_ASPKA|nr:DUF221 domain protein [Aspergillus luchuensis]